MPSSGRRSARRFLRTSPESFLETLRAAECRYVVLRWFDTLPHIQPGEDIDILVHDEDVEKVRGLLMARPVSARVFGNTRLIRCDVYSMSGLSGSSYRGVAYYPPHLAKGILERAQRHASGAMVPSARDHFYSLAFHALYHKGLRSCLPVAGAGITSNGSPEHDYVEILRELADVNGIAVDIEMNALDDELARAGWRPPVDFMQRVLPDDLWIRSRAMVGHEHRAVVDGLAVFIVRESALDREGALDSICNLLSEEGFNILAVSRLSGARQEACERQIRGGNWGRGPWATSGGRPAAAIAALDVFPISPSRRLKAHHPGADNQRVFATKDRIRDLANTELAPARQFNAVHSSDNAAEAVRHLDLLFPEECATILEHAVRLTAAVDLPGKVVRRLDRSGRRALVEVIRSKDGTLAVRKRFRPGKEPYFERELAALTALGQISSDVVPPVIESGPNFIVTPYYADRRSPLARWLPIPVPALRKAFHSAKTFFEHGYVLPDFRPHNLIVENSRTIKIVDLEDVYERKPGDTSDFASLEMLQPEMFDSYWGRATGLTPKSLLSDPLWLLYIKRIMIGFPAAGLSMLRKFYRRIGKRVQRRRQRIALRRARRLAHASHAGALDVVGLAAGPVQGRDP